MAQLQAAKSASLIWQLTFLPISAHIALRLAIQLSLPKIKLLLRVNVQYQTTT